MEVFYHYHYPIPKCISVRDIALYYHLFDQESSSFSYTELFSFVIDKFEFFQSF